MSQSRLNVCDNYKSQISEPAKTVRLYKEQQLKKVSWSFFPEAVFVLCRCCIFPMCLLGVNLVHVGLLVLQTYACCLFPFSQTIDQLSGIQAELQESVKELAKAKKKYYDCEQVAHAIREKADIEAK